MCILLSMKNTLGIQKKVSTESDRCPEVAAGQNQRTVSCLQDRLRTGGPKQEILLYPDILQLRLQLQSTTLRYYYHYYYRLPRKIRLPQLLLRTTVITEVVLTFKAKNFEKYHFKNR